MVKELVINYFMVKELVITDFCELIAIILTLL